MAEEAKYRCKQHELYSVSRAGLHSFMESQARFADFKAKYGSPYETDFEALIDAAMDIPSFQGRDSDTEVAGIELKKKAAVSLELWQGLKRYIRDVKDWKDLQKPRLEEAGSKLYEKAAAYNWEYVLQLNHEAFKFIGTHSGVLQAGNNMPAIFVTDFESAKSDYSKYYSDLLDKKQDNPEVTDSKVKANNVLHDALTDMFDDGQYVMRHEPALKARFTFTRVLNIVRRPTSSGGGTGGGDTGGGGPSVGLGSLRGKVTSNADGSVLEGALVTLTAGAFEVTLTTDSNGLYASGELRDGDYAVTVWDENHEQIEQTVTVTGGTTQNFVMKPLE